MNSKKNSMDNFKKAYDSIDIPDELQSIIEESIGKGRKKMKRNSTKKLWIRNACAGVAATFIVCTALINTMPAFAQGLQDIPGVGTLVKILQFNDGRAGGGTVTDGSDIHEIESAKQEDAESIIIKFAKDDSIQNIANHFSVRYSEYPNTMTFTISGARRLSAEKDFENLKKNRFVKDVYKIITLDDSMERFAITFNGPVKYEVKEYKEPAQIVITLKEDNNTKNVPVYSVRTASYPFGETLGIIEERLIELKDMRILKDREGTFLVETGYFESEDEANKKIKEFSNILGPDIELYVEKRNPDDIPEVKINSLISNNVQTEERSNIISNEFLAVWVSKDKTSQGIIKLDQKSLSFFAEDNKEKAMFSVKYTDATLKKMKGEASFILQINSGNESYELTGLFSDFFDKVSEYTEVK